MTQSGFLVCFDRQDGVTPKFQLLKLKCQSIITFILLHNVKETAKKEEDKEISPLPLLIFCG